MHLILSHAAPRSESQLAALASTPLPHLDLVIRHWTALPRDEADEFSLSTPQERALASALGWAAPDGCLPWAARHAAAGGIDVGSLAWGLVTPVHARVGSDGVHLAEPASLALDATESRAFFDAVQPLFDADGWRLVWGAPLRWYALHSSLQRLATASIDRVAGRNVDAWLPRQPEARALRRLQNDVQMLLHDHPLNQAREAVGALPVNSFWLSGCGVRQVDRAADIRVDDRLREPALRGDDAAWCAAWRSIDGEAIGALVAGAERGDAATLSVCGERACASFAARPRRWWHRLGARLLRPSGKAHALLAAL